MINYIKKIVLKVTSNYVDISLSGNERAKYKVSEQLLTTDAEQT